MKDAEPSRRVYGAVQIRPVSPSPGSGKHRLFNTQNRLFRDSTGSVVPAVIDRTKHPCYQRKIFDVPIKSRSSSRRMQRTIAAMNSVVSRSLTVCSVEEKIKIHRWTRHVSSIDKIGANFHA